MTTATFISNNAQDLLDKSLIIRDSLFNQLVAIEKALITNEATNTLLRMEFVDLAEKGINTDSVQSKIEFNAKEWAIQTKYLISTKKEIEANQMEIDTLQVMCKIF